jgi:sacsin
MSFGSDFGQKVDLTASIRNILRNYPEGTAILKELIQNADDAGAHSISFTLDCRSHSADSLAGNDLAQFQGPALHVYNDAIFTEEDFKSIQRIGDSLKSAAEIKSKIGRFGIGFNAVYHWTDLPSFISSNYLVMLDPQARFLPNVNPSNPGENSQLLIKPSVCDFITQLVHCRFADQISFNYLRLLTQDVAFWYFNANCRTHA